MSTLYFCRKLIEKQLFHALAVCLEDLTRTIGLYQLEKLIHKTKARMTTHRDKSELQRNFEVPLIRHECT